MSLTNHLFQATSVEQTFNLQRQLMKFLHNPIAIRLNTNSSHFISIRFSESMKPISASIHHLFAQAPQPIMQVLARFIQTGGSNQSLENDLRRYLLLASGQKSAKTAFGIEKTQGQWYDLKEIFHDVNQRFFDSTHDSSITWFSSKGRKKPSLRCSLGLYVDELSLVKINRLLDAKEVPPYVIEAIVYHEMLHAIYPPKTLPSGRRIIHTEEFKRAERNHPKFLEAERWLSENRYRFFAQVAPSSK